jgi:hypothetical integral membrane protein (TIGR02206 family)
MSPPPFVLFGPAHISALAAVALTAAALSAAARAGSRSRAPRVLAAAMGLAILAAIAIGLASDGLRGRLSVWDFVPLNLCDFAIVLAAVALLTRWQPAYELLYFWSLSGTLLAMLTPDLTRDFPGRQFVSFFVFHGSVVTTALFLTWGLRMRPRAGAARRVFFWTNLYAAIAAVVDYTFDRNYLYLREKPAGWSPLQWFGPWPVYLLAAEAIALVSFAILAAPFRTRRDAAGDGRHLRT